MSTQTLPSQVFVSHPTGKMAGIPVITTSMLCNPICEQRCKDSTSVCHKCYARRGLQTYAAARKRYEINSELLSSHDLLQYEIPVINSLIARFESHGDLINVIHAKNYIKIAQYNPWCTFSLWTKNAEIMNKALQEMGKPDNLICIFSSSKLNEVDLTYKKYAWIDKVFTVYTKEYIADNQPEINCGAKQCALCKKCYTKENKEFFVSEKLK